MKFRSMRVGSLAGALVLLAQGLAMAPANAAPDASLAWVDKSLDLKAYEGTSNTQRLELTFSGNPTNPGATINGNLRDVAVVDLSAPAITSDGHATVALTINLPAKAKDTYVGNIQLTENGKPLPQPLHVAVTRTQADAQTIPEEPQMPSPDRIGTQLGVPATVDVLNIQLAETVSDPDAVIKALASARGAQIVAGISELHYYELRFPGATTDTLAAEKDVISASGDVEAVSYALLSSVDGYTNDRETWGSNPDTQTDANWNLRQIDAPAAWDTTTGTDTVVGIIDGGFQKQHEDLSPNIVRSGGLLDIVTGHGTHVAGTACAAGNNGKGVVGVAYNCKLNVQGLGWERDIPEGILKMGMQRIAASSPRPRVVNISIGAESINNCTGSDQNSKAVRDYLKSLGDTLVPTIKAYSSILWVFSAGNSGYDSACSAYGNLGNRSDLQNVVTVAASSIQGTKAGYSVYGSGVTVAAPGGETNAKKEAVHGIRSSWPYSCGGWGIFCTDKYTYLSGTSQAAPHVTGTAALAFSVNRDLQPADVKRCLVSGAAAGGNAIAGQNFSIINAKKTVECARGAQQSAALTNVETVVAGQSGTYALKKDGTVWAWGANYSGELGNGTTDSSAVPTQVAGLSGVSAIAAGAGDAYALKSDGTVWAWGLNDRGQLGNGTTGNSSTPVRVPGLPAIASISTRGGAAFAVGTDGSAWGWGVNWLGQLGIGPDASASSPVRLAIPEAVKAIYPGGYTGYALTTKGTVWSWGDNGAGQLGNGTTTASNTPVQVSGLSSATRLFTSSASVAYALMPDQTIKVWGEGSGGALGNGTYGNSSLPITVPNIGGVTQIAGAPGHTFVRLGTGRVLAWGNNWMGALGNGTTDNTATPTPVSGISTASSIASAGRSSWALLSDGTLRAWGAGFLGALGNGTTADSNPTPVAVSGLTGVVSIVAGSDAAYAVKSDGTLWSWGANWGSQLGRHTSDSFSATPGRV